MKKILVLMLSLFISFNIFINVKAENSNKIIDETNVLSIEEKDELNKKIDDFIKLTNYDLVIYVVENHPYLIEHKDRDDAITYLADNYYDQNGYGLNEDNDGLILLIDIGIRNYTISTCGESCINTYNDMALNDIYNDLYAYFSNNEWSKGLIEFADKTTYIYNNYDYYHPKSNYPQEESNPFVEALMPSLFGALIITLISFLILKGQLKNTGIKHSATSYMSNQKINILRSGDIYLYTDILREKIEKPKQDNQSTSSTHISSSGNRHGGGGSHKF